VEFCPPKKIREQMFLKALFSFGDETYEDITIREGHFEYLGSFRDEKYGDIKK
jgi:hypothetical protein